MTWLIPCITKAAKQSNINITTSPATINRSWYPYIHSIQVRPGWTVGKDNENGIGIIPIAIDFDVLYINSFFASQLESYPRIGLSLWMPYALHKEQKLRFPNIWGILTYIELYKSHPALSTWGHRVSIGAIKGGDQLGYSFLSIVSTEEITYHWLCTPSWQLNFGIGLLINWWTKNRQDRSRLNQANTTDQMDTNTETLNVIDNDSIILTSAPLATIGIRYTSHTRPFFRPGNHPIHYRKVKSSRVDCSITSSCRRLPSTQKYYLIFRGSALLSFTINAHNGLLCSMELGYNQYKKALLTNMLPGGGIEVTTLLGYEIRYGRCLLQLQLGYEITDFKKPTIQTFNENSIFTILYRRSRLAANIQYLLTEHFFVGISARLDEIPALRLGVSW